MNRARKDLSAKTIVYNGTPFEVNVQKMSEVSPYARTMFQNPSRTYEINDKFSVDVFAVFIGLILDSQVPLEPEKARDLIELITNWGAEQLERELERRILETRNNQLVLQYALACPNSLPAIFSYMFLHMDQFAGFPEYYDLPISSLLPGLSQTTETGKLGALEDTEYSAVYDSINMLRKQEMELDQQKNAIESEVAAIKQRITDGDALNQQITRKNDETNNEIDKIRAQISDKKKNYNSLSADLNKANKELASAKREMEKARTNLFNQKKKVSELEAEYDKLASSF